MRRWVCNRIRRSDSGFTLIELLITTVIMGAITLPLGNLIISYFTTSNTTTGRLGESHDEQISAAYFARDVASVGLRGSASPYASAQSIWTGSFPAGSCGSSGGGTSLILIRWDNRTWTGSSEAATVNSAGYYLRTVSGQNQLRRVYCEGAVQIADVVLAHDVNLGGTNQITCSSTCTSATLPTTVTLQLAIKDPAGAGQPYAFTLKGQRRQS